MRVLHRAEAKPIQSQSAMETLPVETLQQILSYLDNPSDTSSLARCSRVLKEVATDPRVWEPHLNSYQFGNKDIQDLYLQTPRKKAFNNEATEAFRIRATKDRRIEKCVRSMVENPHGRLQTLETIAIEFLDGADAVRRLRRQHGRVKKNYGIDYYCRLIECHLSRRIGQQLLRDLNRLPSSVGEGMMPICVLFAINCFRQSDGLDLHLPSLLDRLHARLSSKCTSSEWEALPVHVQCFDGLLRCKVLVLLETLHACGVCPANSADYHDLRNSFLFYTFEQRRPTIPITMVAIFVALCARMDLFCEPIGFPGQVLAAMKNERNELIYVAPYEGGVAYSRPELVVKLYSYGLRDVESYLSTCTAQEFCIRAARNILNSIERGSDVHTLEGLYAALIAMQEMKSPIPLSEEQFINLVILHFPYDIFLYESRHVPEHKEAITRARLADVTIHKPKRRSEQPVPIRHRLGCIFRHRLFNYVAV